MRSIPVRGNEIFYIGFGAKRTKHGIPPKFGSKWRNTNTEMFKERNVLTLGSQVPSAYPAISKYSVTPVVLLIKKTNINIATIFSCIMLR